jgi:hypothetical protein
VVRSQKKTHGDSADGSSSQTVPVKRIEKIAGLLAELGELMRQEDLGGQSLHHLRQLQMRVRFAQGRPSATDPDGLPQAAPELWSGHQSSEDPVTFIRRVYKDFLGRPGFGRNSLRKLDMSLYKSLRRHIATHGEPPDFDLPSKSELVDRDLANIRPRLRVPHTPEEREKMRLKRAAERRAKKVRD